MNFRDELAERSAYVQKIIEGFLPPEQGFAGTMIKAMNYSMLSGGKRIRPILLLETLRMFGGNEEAAGPFMAAIEMIHTHSLIHDDLPAIDNDDLRRGRKTTHVVFGEAMGILSGDALLNYAYEVMLKAPISSSDPAMAISIIRVMAEKTGIYGMLGGQGTDVENDGRELSAGLLDYIYHHKTSALIEAPMMTGAILSGASSDRVKLVEAAADCLGLAFQIRDDILDVTSTMEELGKPIHSDEKNNKVTYVTLYGVEEASKKVENLSEEAIRLLGEACDVSEFMSELIHYLAYRRG